MSDVNIGARIQVDSGNSTTTIQQLREEIKAAKTELEGAAVGSEQFRAAQERLSKAQNQLSGATAGSSSSIKGLGQELTGTVPGFDAATSGATKLIRTLAALALTPVGAVIMAIAAVFLLIKNAMDRSEESTNKIKEAFSAFSGILSAVLKALEPLGKILIDVIVVSLEAVATAAKAASDALATVLDFLGFDDAADELRGFTEELERSARQAQELARAEAALDEATRKARLTQLQYQKDAEKLRQIRDNQNLSLKERIKANEELGRVLQAQLQDELRLAQAALLVANLRIEQEGRTKATLDAQAAALTQIADIEERITGQASEQLQNRVSLEREAAEKAKAANEKRMAEAKAAREKAEAAEKERIARLQAFEDKYLKARQENELASVIDGIEKKLLAQKFSFTNELAQLDRELAEKRITEAQHRLLVQELEKSNQLAIRVIRNEEQQIYLKELADREAAALKVEEKKKTDIANTVIQQKQAFADLAADETLSAQTKEAIIAQSLANIANSTALTEDQKTALELAGSQARVAIAEAETEAKLMTLEKIGNALNQVSNIVGQQTAVGKATAAASAIINTYLGVTKALGQGGIFGFIGAAAVLKSGLDSVKKIMSTNIPGQSGGIGVAMPTATLSAPLSPMATTTTTQLDQNSINGIGNAAGNRSFVVESDIANNAERIARLNRSARIG